jgi:hypothetical protein
LKLKRQQKKLGPYSADIVFEDAKGDMVIVETKRGILRREALGQIIEYYGAAKQIEPHNVFLASFSIFHSREGGPVNKN